MVLLLQVINREFILHKSFNVCRMMIRVNFNKIQLKIEDRMNAELIRI